MRYAITGSFWARSLCSPSPSLIWLMAGEWSLEQGAAGPIIPASGGWLLVREARTICTMPGHITWAMAGMLPAALGYVFAYVAGMLWLSWLSTYIALIIVLYSYIGGRALMRLWFPLTYLLFLVPPPYMLIASITQSRKLWLSVTSVDLLSALGFEAAYNGTTLYIDQYELLIADACAGMNSLISLLAIGLFYVYVLYRADWRYAILLAMLTLPVAMIANLARILLLLLATHYLGITRVEGVLHETAGLFMFLVALGCLIGLDTALGPLRRRLAQS
ncbi:exosortase [Sphingomonas sp. H160509]|uniref:exosortase n=1 Tax=Sphingomonas sp. H160509 TaxID=2955313 RepID=UPI002097764C|nr:exosortase [Sphingomonas sp. H160509]MDD1453124.1 exosortase [Sphingomonas sp. H160509]